MAKARPVGKSRKKSTKKNRKTKIQIAKKQSFLQSKNLVYLFLLVVLTFLGYSTLFKNDFVNFDDDKFIYNNPQITGTGEFTLTEAFQTQLFTPHYKPLVYLSWRANVKMHGLSAAAIHTYNLIFHLLNTVLVFLIFYLLSSRWDVIKNYRSQIAFLMGFLFAVHPLHVESVAWAVERKDVLFGFFFLTALYTYLLAQEKRQKFALLGVSTLCYLAGILSKAPAITLPVILILLDYSKEGNFRFKQITNKWPYIIIMLIGFYLFGFFGNASSTNTLVDGALDEGQILIPANMDALPVFYREIIFASTRLILFLVHIILPFKMSVIYPQHLIMQGLGPAIHIFPIILIGVVYFLIRKTNARSILRFSALFYFITILPALAIGGSGTNFLSDRYTYIPSLGVFFYAGFLFYKYIAKKNASQGFAYGIAGLLAVVLVYSNIIRVTVWQNSETLWSDALEKFDGKLFQAYMNRGNYYKINEQYGLALSDLNKAVALRANALSHMNRALVLNKMGEYDMAEIDFNQAISKDSTDAKVYLNYGNLFFNKAQYEKALVYYNRALTLDTTIANIYSSRAAVYANLGRLDEGLTDLDKALALNPYMLDALQNRMVINFNKRTYEPIIKDATTYLRMSPSPGIYNLRAEANKFLGNNDLALRDYNEAIRLDPGEAIYLNNRAKFYRSIGRNAEAQRDEQRVQQIMNR